METDYITDERQRRVAKYQRKWNYPVIGLLVFVGCMWYVIIRVAIWLWWPTK